MGASHQQKEGEGEEVTHLSALQSEGRVCSTAVRDACACTTCNRVRTREPKLASTSLASTPFAFRALHMADLGRTAERALTLGQGLLWHLTFTGCMHAQP